MSTIANWPPPSTTSSTSRFSGQRFGMSPDDGERLQLPDAVHFLARHQMRIDRPFNWGLIGSAA
jgi:hypothetical protein